MANVIFANVVAKDGKTPAERFAEMTKNANTFYKVDSELYFGEVHLSADTAAEIGIADLESVLAASNVEAALNELFHDQNAKKIWFHDDSAGQSEYAKVYKIYQGENDYVADPAEGYVNPTLIGTINTPLDKVVQSGSVVEIFFDESDDTLHEGSVSGTDVTEFIKGSAIPTEADAGKYIKLVLQNVDDPLYIAVKDLTDVYTGGTNAEATVVIDEHNVVRVEINKVAATKVTYQAQAAATFEEIEAGTATFDPEQTYYTKSGDVYSADAEVNDENFEDKVAAGLYIKTADAQNEINVKDKIDQVEADLIALDNYVGDLPSGLPAGVDTVIEYVDHKTGSGVGALNAEVGIASKNSSTNVVTIKGGVVETAGKIANSVATAPATTVYGYLNEADGKFYEHYESGTYSDEITGEADTAYSDLTTEKVYVWTSEAFALVREDIALQPVAITGAAADVAYSGVIDGVTVTNVDDAINALIGNLEWNDV